MFNNISCLSSVYVRGEAYLAAGQGSAAAEFRKILDHGGMVWNCGRSGNCSRQRSASKVFTGRGCRRRPRTRTCILQNFLTLWKDVDRDIPILKEAMAEYAKLQ
jgi:hypothetical protein